MKSALPLVLDLAGRLVVAVGGGPVSARRVRALADEGAVVRVISPWVCEDLMELSLGGRVEWQAREYAGAADLAGAWLVHTAAGDAVVDRQVAHDAEDQRIWCIDATDALATAASFPARADVTTPGGRVTISTYAAGDPGLATSLRDGVADAVAAGRARPAANPEAWLGGLGRPRRGWAGYRWPAHHAGSRVAALRRCRRRRSVGSALGRRPVARDRARDRRRQDARPPRRAAVADQRDPRRGGARGLGVVRLKGGDPYVLGRGGEERQAVPGGRAVRRGRARRDERGVGPRRGRDPRDPSWSRPRFHRGHGTRGDPGSAHRDGPHARPVDGRDAAAADGRAAGRPGPPADCPVAIVERGFSPTQRTTVGTLATIAELALARSVESPAVIVVGDVVRLSPEWGTDAE